MHVDVCPFSAAEQSSVCECSVSVVPLFAKGCGHMHAHCLGGVCYCGRLCGLCTDMIFILQKKPWEWAVWTVNMSPPKLSHSSPRIWHCHWLSLGSVSPVWGCVPPFWVPGLFNTQKNIEPICGQLRTAGPASQSFWSLVLAFGPWWSLEGGRLGRTPHLLWCVEWQMGSLLTTEVDFPNNLIGRMVLWDISNVN